MNPKLIYSEIRFYANHGSCNFNGSHGTYTVVIFLKFEQISLYCVYKQCINLGKVLRPLVMIGNNRKLICSLILVAGRQKYKKLVFSLVTALKCAKVYIHLIDLISNHLAVSKKIYIFFN